MEMRIVPATAWTWTGAVSQNWSVAGNWQDGNGNPGVPAAGDSVRFTGGFNQPATVDAAFGGTIGTITMDASYTQVITLQENLTVTTTTQNGGTIQGNFTYTVAAQGAFNWNGGSWSDGGPGNTNAVTAIQNGATVALAAGTYPDAGRTIQNSGTITFSSGMTDGQTTLLLNNSAALQNQSKGIVTTDVLTAATISSADSTGSVANQGLINVGAVQFDIAVPVTNTLGTLQAAANNSVLTVASDVTFNGGSTDGGGTVLFKSTVTINGTVTVPSGIFEAVNNALNVSGTMQFANRGIAPDLVLNGAAVAGPGSINMGGVTVAVFDNAVTLNNITFTSAGGCTINAGASLGLVNNTTFNIAGGGMTTVEFSPNAPATIYGDGTESLTNNATFTVDGTGTAYIAPSFSNKGGGTLNLDAGTLDFSSNWTNGPGTVDFRGGELAVNGTFTNNGTVNATANGTIQANQVINNNKIDLSVATEPVQLNIAGAYLQASTGTLVIGLLADTVCSQLVITGNATLAGNLTVSLVGGYTPPGHGVAWVLLSFGSNQGNTTFDSVTSPPGFSVPTYTAAGVSITS